MTASRTCRACGANLAPDVPWCLRCYEPIRQLTPRDRQLPTPPGLEPIDPASVRRDHAWVRLERPVYSRVRGGATSFGLWGRVALTAFVLLWLPWGQFGFASVLYLLGYIPIAALLLSAVWRKDVVGTGDAAAARHDSRTLTAIRISGLAIGSTLLVTAVGSHSNPLGYLPAAPFLLVTLFVPAAEAMSEAIQEARGRPLGTLILLNGLNVLDAILTDAAIGAGVARELNPLVLAIGQPAKLALVAACSALVLWKRPETLVWPTLVFLALAAYHLTGLLGSVALA